MNKTSLYLKAVSVLFPERCPFCDRVIAAEAICCGKCAQRAAQRTPCLRGVLGYRCAASFVYANSVRKTILAIKYFRRTQAIRQLGYFLAEDIKRCYPDERFDLITAVPMYPRDKRERQYNQAELIGQMLSKYLSIPFIPTLKKIKKTKRQHHLRYRDKKTNLNGAFELIDKSLVKGKRVLIVDDVVTSGYTLGTCCRTLNKAKPELLCCAAIAHADLNIDNHSVN